MTVRSINFKKLILEQRSIFIPLSYQYEGNFQFCSAHFNLPFLIIPSNKYKVVLLYSHIFFRYRLSATY